MKTKTIALCTCDKGRIGDEKRQELHKTYKVTEALEDGTCKYCGYYVQYRRGSEVELGLLTYLDIAGYRHKRDEVDFKSAFEINKSRNSVKVVAK